MVLCYRSKKNRLRQSYLFVYNVREISLIRPFCVVVHIPLWVIKFHSNPAEGRYPDNLFRICLGIFFSLPVSVLSLLKILTSLDPVLYSLNYPVHGFLLKWLHFF